MADLDLMLHVLSRTKPHHATGCIVWTGDKGRDGYGKLKARGRWHQPHAIMLERFNGPRPDGMAPTHSSGCASGLCVNPYHLRWGEDGS